MIRDAAENQIDAIAELIVAAYDEYAPPPGDPLAPDWAEYRIEMADVGSRWPLAQHLVIEEGGRLLATATFFPDASIIGEDAFPEGYASMRLLAVHPEARGRKLGRLLTEECIARSQAMGRAYMGLHTTRLMTIARDMYERMGFERFPENDIEVTEDFIVVAYRLRLS